MKPKLFANTCHAPQHRMYELRFIYTERLRSGHHNVDARHL